MTKKKLYSHRVYVSSNSFKKFNRENDKINEEGEEVHLEKSMRLDIKNKFMLWKVVWGQSIESEVCVL